MTSTVNDLRGALELLRTLPGQLLETNIPVNPEAELSGVYRHVGAGGTVARPTKEGPAMLFNNVEGFPGARVVTGVLASRTRTAALLGAEPTELGRLLAQAAAAPVAPVVTSEAPACQEVVYRATDPGFDVRTIVPAPTNTPQDAGPYITIGMVYATHPETGVHDVTIHRMCLQGPDEISFYAVPGSRHIGTMAEAAERLGRPLPVSINIGVDPAIEVGACFEPPTTPLGYDELSVAGALRGEAVRLAPCITVNELCIANAEYVIEGEILPGARVREDQHTNLGFAMPEFPGYTGPASTCNVIKVKAVTHRSNPIMQSVIGPSEEHVNLAGIPTEASILTMVDAAMPGKLRNVYCASCGGGKYLAVLQFAKTQPSDEGRQRQAALLAFSAFSELKNVFLVDEDVDPFDISDVLWAMNTRCQTDVDVICIPGVRCHPLDPSNDPSMSPSIRDHGIACKTIFDCTVPWAERERFHRAAFMEIDRDKWASVL